MVNKQKLNPLPKLSNFALEIENLNFCYHPDKPRVLKDINIRITPGQYVTVIGHNGSGKSTLSKLITGVLRYQTGTIKIFGHPITPRSIAEIRQFLGIVFQNPDNQFIGSTVMDDVAFGLECRQVPQHLMESMIIQALAKVKMTKFLDFEPWMLSGGQKQKVAIASVLAMKPEIILFDESTSMLDPRGRKDIKKIMTSLRGKHTIISITHDMNEIINSDSVIVMNDGKVLMHDTPDVVLKQEQLLKSIHLDVPFVLKVISGLKADNVPVQWTLSEDNLITQLKRIKETEDEKRKQANQSHPKV